MLIKRALSHQKLLCKPLPTNSSQKKATFCHHHLTLRWKKENPPHTFFHNLSNNQYRAKTNLLSFQRRQKLSPKNIQNPHLFFTTRIPVLQNP